MRKYRLRYIDRLHPDRQPTPLRFGGAVHVGLDLCGQGRPEDEALAAAVEGYATMPAWAKTAEDFDEWAVERESVIALLRGYWNMWRESPIKTIASEIEFCLPLRTNKGRKTRRFIAGKIDAIGQCGSELAVIEHKTTSENIDPASDYWRRLTIDQQISLYFHAARELEYDVATVVYDVIRKPRIWLRKGESPEAFGKRLADDIASRPSYYYCRREIPRLNADLAEAIDEVRQMDQSLRNAAKHNAYPRNTAACMFPRRCEFFDLCCNGYDPAAGVPAGFVQLTTPHPELPNVSTASPAPAASIVGSESACAVQPANG